MTPVTPAQFFAILVFAAMVLGINFGFWLWANRGHDRLTLTVEDQRERDDTADDLMAVADAVAECGVRYVRGPGLTYVCRRAAHSITEMHDDGVRWFAEGDLDLTTEEPVAVNPPTTLGQERLYDAEGLVQYGLELVDRRCLDARRDFATDLICASCRDIFGRVAA